MNIVDLEKYVPINNMILQYETAKKEVTQAFNLLVSAKNRMGIFGTYYNHLWKSRISDYDLEKKIENCHRTIKENAWRGIVDKTKIRELLSEKSSKELDKQLENVDELPELSVESVKSLLENLHGNLGNLLQETLEETFDFCRPPQSKYKTNTEYEVGEKVIKKWIFYTSYGYVNLNYYRDSEIRSLDNCFHLLDGKGSIKYPGDALTKIREALQNKKWEVETEYFYFKWFKNGNLHIKFKRMDLVKELNRRAGGNKLKNKM